MAKLERKKSIFFGSWTGAAIAATATGTIITGSALTAVAVVAATFGTKVSGSGAYDFVYAATGTTWKLNGTAVDIAEYGITVTGTPANNDKIRVDYTRASGGWEALGKDNDDLTKALNPDTETTKNVLGETAFKHSGYSPEVDMDPYYMDPGRLMYEHLLDCALQEKYGEADLLGYFAEAFFTEADEVAQTMTGYCYVRRAWFVPQSTGGDTSGYSIPFNVTPVGAMTKKNISYNMSTNEATITDSN